MQLKNTEKRPTKIITTNNKTNLKELTLKKKNKNKKINKK